MKKSKELLPYLITLAKLGALKKKVDISTSQFAKEFSGEEGISQQTASRKLKELEEIGWITRDPSIKGLLLRITPAGSAELEEVQRTLVKAFEPFAETIEIKGKLFTGVGEGGHYIRLPNYYNQFRKKLGFSKIFEGTLNLRLESERDLHERRILQEGKYPGISIEGFKNETRTYGPVTCYPAKVNGSVEGAVLIIQRTSWKEDVLEIISPHYLREVLNLKDGDIVTVLVILN